MIHENWIRICIEEDDYQDVLGSFIEISNLIDKYANVNKDSFLIFQNVIGFKVAIKLSTITHYYEHGVDYLVKVWERNKEMEELRKETTPRWEGDDGY